MFAKKSLVLYKNQPAIVLECGEKYLIEFSAQTKSGSATQNVREKDIIQLHSGCVTNLTTVCDFAKKAENLFTQESLVEIWELYEPNKPVPFLELAELLDNAFCADHAWGVYSFLRDSSYFFVQNEINFVPRTAEEITALKQKNTAKEQESQFRQDFCARLKSKKVCVKNDGSNNPASDTKFLQEIEALALGKTEHCKILKEAGFKEEQEIAHSILIETGFWSRTKNPYPSRWGLSMQSASESLLSPPKEKREKIDCTAYAIDNAWSSDPDDAVAFDGEFLWVHVADPASTVTPDSKIDISARHRGSTLYIPERAVRMLSEECLEDYALGLTPLSNALSFKIKLDAQGAIEDCSVHKSIVKVERFTYEQVSALKTEARFAPLFAIAERNIEKRKKNGAVFIDLPEVHISVQDEQVVQSEQFEQSAQSEQIVHINPIEQTEAAIMIRECMLLAGEAAARFAFKNAIPFPYVRQEAPEIPKDLPKGLAGQYRLRRSMRSRSVGVTPSNHAGLGLGMYSQVTSPLRRYGDLAAHQQLRSFLDKKPLLDKDTLLEHIAAGDASAAAAVKAERKSNLHWTLVWLLQHPDWKGKAVIVELKDREAIVIIPQLAHEARIGLQKNMQLNDEITVKIQKISIPKLTAEFVVC